MNIKKITSKLLIISFITFFSCTHYQPINYDELNSKGLIGRWEMSMDPYYIEILCNGEMHFIKPSTNFLYGDQKGSSFVITQFEKNKIIAGPVVRTTFQVDEWPHDENERTLMTLDGRIWHKSKNFNCID